jgi:hypothetical protein
VSKIDSRVAAWCFADPDSAVAAVCYEPSRAAAGFTMFHQQLLNLLPDTVRRKLSLALQSLPRTIPSTRGRRQLLTRPLLT